MSLRTRLKRLEVRAYGARPAYRIFVKDAEAPGSDADGWRAGEREAAAAAGRRGDRVIEITVSTRAPSAVNQRGAI